VQTIQSVLFLNPVAISVIGQNLPPSANSDICDAQKTIYHVESSARYMRGAVNAVREQVLTRSVLWSLIGLI